VLALDEDAHPLLVRLTHLERRRVDDREGVRLAGDGPRRQGGEAQDGGDLGEQERAGQSARRVKR
jgi:hypothetical protein